MYLFGDTYFQGPVTKNIFQIAFIIVIITELTILFFTSWNSYRSSEKRNMRDRGSILFIMAGYWLAILLNPICVRVFSFVVQGYFFWIGITLTILGVVIRVYSVWTLRKFFTLAVQVGADQKLIQDGPYKHIRHPAYTGSILTLLGVALSFRSPLGFVETVIIIAAVYGYRIKIEETALEKRFEASYKDYERNTWRLLPHIW